MDTTMENNTIIHADDVIGRMHATCEEARTIIDHVESEYFQNAAAKNETMLAIQVDYVKIGTMLRAALDLLYTAEEYNLMWQNRPEEQVKKEVEA